jgi:GMP synthase-like glutamine amidotransferase
MIIHVVQHVAFETPGIISQWAAANSHTLTTTHAYHNEPFPDPTSFDWLIVMGGPMSTKDEDCYPWLAAEKTLIHHAIEQGNVVLGICLGAQLIAEVLGATVFPNDQREIGWFPITFTEKALRSPIFAFAPPTTTVFHWHGDTFDVPPRAVPIASSKACRNQAFVYEHRVVGLQFHLEMHYSNVQAITENCAEELAEYAGAPFVQTAETILQTTQYLAHNNAMMRQILTNLACR